MVVGDIAGGGGVGGLLLVVLENIGLLVVVVGDIAGGGRCGGGGDVKGPCICCSTAHKPQSSPRKGYFSFFLEELVLFSSDVLPLRLFAGDLATRLLSTYASCTSCTITTDTPYY